MEANSNTLRILICTDNHLGYKEKDELRKNDSFNAFEECLQRAKQLQADFVLLGGDLFHENKPSQYTIKRTMDIIRSYSRGSEPIQFQIVSDQSHSFANSLHVNYEDPNLNIGLPVFAIHGNHDDPTGAESVSVMDIMSTSGLINYFGKTPIGASGGSAQETIKINPILIQKGHTYLALYGLGHIRDERLCRKFQEPGGVKWVVPPSVEQDWFNLFTIHQNREARGMKNYIKNEYLPKFLDLIVWGHEHKSCPEPEEFEDFHILQLGSTVQTDLSENEAFPKHCVLLEVNGREWRTEKYELQRARPFWFERVVLKNIISQSHWTEETISEMLMSKVETIANQVKENTKRQGRDPILPLVRLRVDYTGFTTINIQRFGSKLVGKVANPKETLLFVKSSAQSRRKDGSVDMAEGSNDLDLLFEESENQVVIEDLIKINLAGKDLEILPENEFNSSLSQFIQKEEKNALASLVNSLLEETCKKLVAPSPEIVDTPAEKEHIRQQVDKIRIGRNLLHQGDSSKEPIQSNQISEPAFSEQNAIEKTTDRHLQSGVNGGKKSTNSESQRPHINGSSYMQRDQDGEMPRAMQPVISSRKRTSKAADDNPPRSYRSKPSAQPTNYKDFQDEFDDMISDSGDDYVAPQDSDSIDEIQEVKTEPSPHTKSRLSQGSLSMFRKVKPEPQFLDDDDDEDEDKLLSVKVGSKRKKKWGNR